MMSVLFTKKNRLRLPEFQIETTIECSDNQKWVCKKALTLEAKDHIVKMANNYQLLSNSYIGKALIAESRLKDDRLIMDFVEGDSYESKLHNIASNGNKELLIIEIEIFTKFINNLCTRKYDVFQSNEKFERIFGEKVRLENIICLEQANIDLTFDNVIINSFGELTIIDYEWVFEFPVPIDFILYRILKEFYNKYRIQLTNMIKLEELFEYSLDTSNLSLYQRLDIAFQKYVVGDHIYELIQVIEKCHQTIADKDEQIRENTEYIEKCHQTIADKDEQIRENTEYIEKCHQTIADKDEQIRENTEHIGKCHQTIADKDEQIRENTEYIEKCRQTIADKDEQIRENTEYIEKCHRTIADKDEQIRENTEYIEKCHQTIADKDGLLNGRKFPHKLWRR